MRVAAAAVSLVVAAGAAGCARTVPADPTMAALYRDLERQVTVAAAAGWSVDRLEVEDALPAALDSVCRVEPGARRRLLAWIDAEIVRLGGPVEVAFERRGRDLSAVDDLLVLTRARKVLARADEAAAADCPFWIGVEHPFRGRQISDDRWMLTLGGGGKGIAIRQGDQQDLSFGGAGRLLAGRGLGSRSALFVGLELGASASFPKDDLGERGALRIAVDLVAPLVYRHTFTSAYVEAEAGWVGHTTEDALGTIDHGFHLGVSVGARALRTRFFFPGAALGLSYEQVATDGPDLQMLKLGARVAFDANL